jgi:hypothetical protein
MVNNPAKIRQPIPAAEWFDLDRSEMCGHQCDSEAEMQAEIASYKNGFSDYKVDRRDVLPPDNYSDGGTFDAD